ncbi:hypothetical protein LX36DRAFT_712170 [Colletotrichum falcatum]|nr:hypothetical protein LX36DRAFT_712170 [Colletotrichum falcatum]
MPLGYSVGLCIGNGNECELDSPWAVCGTPGATSGRRAFCEPSGTYPIDFRL